MVITKSIKEAAGLVEYSVKFNGYSEDGEICEFEKFKNLKELLSALSASKLNEIKDEFGASQVTVASITFSGSAEDNEVKSEYFLTEDSVKGTIVAKINNSDIDNRLLNNLEGIKKILDNALEQYPIKY